MSIIKKRINNVKRFVRKIVQLNVYIIIIFLRESVTSYRYYLLSYVNQRASNIFASLIISII